MSNQIVNMKFDRAHYATFFAARYTATRLFSPGKLCRRFFNTCDIILEHFPGNNTKGLTPEYLKTDIIMLIIPGLVLLLAAILDSGRN